MSVNVYKHSENKLINVGGGGDHSVELSQAEYDELVEKGEVKEDVTYYVTDGSIAPSPVTWDKIFFKVNVTRPIPFSDSPTTQSEEIECVLRLPKNYSPNGKPTRFILACHGASGYIQKSTGTWYNSNWTAFMDELVNAGYGVFDVNIFSGDDTAKIGYALGSPLAVQVAKRAYDYITDNYNAYKQIFVHGTSMGGTLANAFSQAYPELVLAESSFAGRDFVRYITIWNNTPADKNAIAYGYNSWQELEDDKFSHCDGVCPSLGLVKIDNGAVVLPPNRNNHYEEWKEYWYQLGSLTRDSDPGIWIGRFPVPYKCWNSWADNEAYTKFHEVVKDAYNLGNSPAYYSVTYEEGTHTQMSYGQINNMIPELISWYKRWE